MKLCTKIILVAPLVTALVTINPELAMAETIATNKTGRLAPSTNIEQTHQTAPKPCGTNRLIPANAVCTK